MYTNECLCIYRYFFFEEDAGILFFLKKKNPFKGLTFLIFNIIHELLDLISRLVESSDWDCIILVLFWHKCHN